MLPYSDDNRRNGRFWLLEAGKEGEVETKIFYHEWDKALRFWTKETTEELMDVASILEEVDSDEWVLLSITEQHHHKMWRLEMETTWGDTFCNFK